MKLKMFFCASLLMFGLYSFSGIDSSENLEKSEEPYYACTGGEWNCNASQNNRHPKVGEVEELKVFNFSFKL